jgi:hypothetical protein
MEKRKIKSTSRKPKKMTEEERVTQSLLADGAVEIPRKMWNKEPYKTFMKSIKRNGKFICE